MPESTSNNSSTNNAKAPQKVSRDDDFVIEAVKEKDYERCVTFLVDHFLPREPMAKGVHLSIAKFEKQFRKKAMSLMPSGASVCAIHKPSDEIAGVMATQILTKEQSDIFTDMTSDEEDESIQNLMALLTHLEKSVNLFEDPKVTKVLELALTAVHSKFAGHRLTYRITAECEKLAVNLSCQLATSQSTNQITQHIRTKIGYQVRYTLDLASFEVDGKKVLDLDAMEGTTIAQVLTKYLKKE